MEFDPNRCCCGAEDTLPMFAVGDVNFAATAARAMLMRCGDCGSLFPDRFPAATSLSAAYARYYTAAPASPAGLRSWVGSVLAGSRGAYLDRGVPDQARRVLDFGAGSGAFLRRLAARRPDLQAFGAEREPADHMAGWTSIGLSEIEAHGPYDWITAGHVLEHLADPATALARLAACLSPQGGLWIATPNAQGFLFRAAGPYARDVDFPRHKQIFSRTGLERLAAGAGLSCRFLAAPGLNAALNTLSSAANAAKAAELWSAARAAAALAVHLALSARRVLESSPELVAVCTRAAP